VEEGEIREYIKSVRWVYAKTMPRHPHEYTLRNWRIDKIDEFNRFILFIREQGYDEYFYKKKMRYYNIDGYKYWTMGSPLEETILINRARL